jgi:hypothetical protein
MSLCFRCGERIPPHLEHLPALNRACACAHLQSTTPRSQSVPRRSRNLKQSTTSRSRSAPRPNIHERRAWYEGPRTKKEANAVNVKGGKPQPHVPSCDSGIYKKLDESKRQIRLLELHPGSGETPISGNLITVDLPALPPDFEEDLFFTELIVSAVKKIAHAVRSGKWVPQGDVDRWEFVQDSLIWLFRYRLLESYHILRDARGTPTADTVDRLKGMRLSRSATFMQKLPTEFAKALLCHSVHHSWTHDLNGLISRLCAQGTQSRHSIIHFAEQMDTAIEKFISEGSDAGSALTPVDVPGLESFLAEVDVGLCTEFCAVSWFWGDLKPSERVELDGRYLEVPRNAIRALRDLRDTDHLKRLWIDAVCINQDDKAERASQILLMSDIYSSAGMTYVSLGTDEAVMQPAIVHLKDVLRWRQKAVDFGIRVVEDINGSPSGASNLSVNKIDTTQIWLESYAPTKPVEELLRKWPAGHRMTETDWQYEFISRRCNATWPIFKLPWFSRLWVLQEVVLSRRCRVVFGPNTTLPWEDLEGGVSLMHKCLGAPRGFGLISAILEHHVSDTRKNGFQLLRLVAHNANQECSDPRDYIFGLLGLTTWARRRLRWPHLLEPNYVKSISDCMRDATRVMIQEECDLSALLHWCQVGQSPTWAIHWHRHRHIRYRTDWYILTKSSKPYSSDLAPLDLHLMEKFPDLDILFLKGHSVSFVHSTAPVPTLGDEIPMTAEHVLDVLDGVLRRIMDLSTRTGVDFSTRTITLTLMICGASVLTDQPLLSGTEEFRRFEPIVSNRWSELHGQTSEHYLDHRISASYMLARFYGIYGGVSLFTTQAGQLCVGPEGVREGDKIVQLFGLPLPAVLRPEQSWYTFAGVAYLDREFPDVQDTSTLPPEIYEVR